MSGSFLCRVGTWSPFSLFTAHLGYSKSLHIIALHLLFYSISTYLLRTYYVPGTSWVLRDRLVFCCHGFYSDPQRSAITMQTNWIIPGGFMYGRGNKIQRGDTDGLVGIKAGYFFRKGVLSLNYLAEL